MNRFKGAALAATVYFMASGNISAAAQTCAHFENDSADKLISYLGHVAPNIDNGECIAFAVNKLGGQRYEPAVPVLAKFLDFRWPRDARQKQRLFVLEHDGASIYPAATALEQIGANALPEVLNAIKSGSLSREAMEVAVSVWMTIYKDQAPLGVALLKQEADRTPPSMAKQRLGWAAFQAAMGWCSAEEKAQCNAAVAVNYSNTQAPVRTAPGSSNEPQKQ